MHNNSSPQKGGSVDGFVVRPQRSRYAGYKPLHRVGQDTFVDPKRLRPDSSTSIPSKGSQPTPRSAPRKPLVSPVSSATAAHTGTMPASPLQQAVQAPRRPLGRHDRHGAKAAKAPKKRRSLKHWLTHWNVKKAVKVFLLAVLVLVLVGGGWLGWKVYRNAAKITHNNNPLNLLSAFKPVPLKNTDGRVNVLLAGNSADDPGHDGASLTDSIMVMSIDTRTKQASMLSIPRDLWVNISSLGHQKINAANTVTKFSEPGYPQGGMGQLEAVVSENLGIPIHYYALINYGAFRDAVNAVGGITITVQSSDPRGLYDPSIDWTTKGPLVKLPNGPVTLNGQQALNLARARGDAYRSYGFPKSDFDRTTHQRQMLLALKTKAVSSKVLTNPLKVGELADAIGNNVQTDMKINEIETFYSYIKGVSDSNITSLNVNDLVKDQMLLKSYTSPSGQSALIPASGVDDFSAIKLAIARIFSADPLVRENAQVVVLNGGGVTGLARQEADLLTAKKITVAAVADAPKTYPTTEIIDNSKGAMPHTKQALQKLFGTNVVAGDTAITGYTADFIVVLGQNQPAPRSSSTDGGSAAVQ